MIIYGSGMYGKRDKVHGWGHCTNCNRYGKQASYNGRKWGHLYFIPLIPEGGHVRVIKECKSCSHGLHFPEEEVPGMLQEIQESIDYSIQALTEGNSKYRDLQTGDEINCIGNLAESVELLYCLGDPQYNAVLEKLKQRQLKCAFHLVNGTILEMHGKVDEAIAEYEEASRAEAHNPSAWMFLGAAALLKKDMDGAQDAYERAAKIDPQNPFPLLSLIDVYQAKKDFNLLASTYERAFEVLPELAQDKKMYKGYKKACKKIYKEPMAY